MFCALIQVEIGKKLLQTFSCPLIIPQKRRIGRVGKLYLSTVHS